GEGLAGPQQGLAGLLPVIGAEHYVVALQEGVQAAGRLDEGRNRGVAPRERLVRSGGPERVGREVVVREVVEEEVEAVARDEPAAAGGCVRIDRAQRAAADREGRAGDVRLEEAEVEEPPRPFDGAHDARDGGGMSRPASVTGDIDGGRDKAGVP